MKGPKALDPFWIFYGEIVSNLCAIFLNRGGIVSNLCAIFLNRDGIVLLIYHMV
jgi:hypothetical protein